MYLTRFLKKINNNSVLFLFRKVWRFGEGQHKKIVLFILLTSIAQLVLLSTPLVFKEFLDELQRNGFDHHNINYLLFLLLSIIFISLLFWLFHGPSRIIQRDVAFHIRNNYRQYLLTKMLHLNLSWHGAKDSGDSIDKVNKSSDGLYRFSIKFYKIINMIIKIIGTTVTLMFFNTYVGIFSLILLVVALFLTSWFDRRLVVQYQRLNVFDNKISAKIFDVLSNITSVKILGIEDTVFHSIKKSLWKPLNVFRKNARFVELKWFVGQVFFTLVIVIPIIFYVLYLYRHNLSVEIGTLSAMYLYLSNLRTVYFAFAGIYDEIMVYKAQVMNAHEIENVTINQTTRKTLTYHWKKMKITHLRFKYNDSHTEGAYHLNDVSFSLKRGEKIACIGESGSGKTTFLKVIHGLYENAAAEISFDNGENISTSFSDIDLGTTLVPQEPELFSASIRENVTFGLDYSDTQIMNVLNLSEFSSVLVKLPKELDSVINEKGVNLSGGQKQRLALARALLFSRDKEIILLDESTSSVDSSLEVKIYKNIFNTFLGKTFIASVHKMNLLKYFDKIVIFENGKIIDSGSFDDLYKRNTKFSQQWDEYIKLY